MRTINFDLVSSKKVSWLLLTMRVLLGIFLLYFTLGNLFFYREFLYNITALGMPFPITLGFGLLGLEFVAAIFLLVGWFTRFFSVVQLVVSIGIGIFFFAMDINKIFVALVILLCMATLPTLWLGAGKYSLDFKKEHFE